MHSNRVATGKTVMEGIMEGNSSGQRLRRNDRYFNRLFGEDRNGNRKMVPADIWAARPLGTGTVFLLPRKGEPFGKAMEKEFTYEGAKKTLVHVFTDEEAALVNTLLLFNHGFAGKKPLVGLLDDASGESIASERQMRKAKRVHLVLNGEARRFPLRREGRAEPFERGKGEQGDGWDTYVFATDSSAMGVLVRGHRAGGRQDVWALDDLDMKLGFLYLDRARQKVVVAARKFRQAVESLAKKEGVPEGALELLEEAKKRLFLGGSA